MSKNDLNDLKVDENGKEIENENEIKVNSLDELTLGDHAIVVFNLKHFTHVIVESVAKDENSIGVIYYRNNDFPHVLNDYFKNKIEEIKDKNDVQNSIGVLEADVLIDFHKLDVYKVVYDENKTKCLKSSETVAKAKSFIHRTQYDAFTNTDEHFATFCKTGISGQLLVANPDVVELKDIFESNLSARIKRTLTTTGAKLVINNTAQHIATKFPRNAIATCLPKAVATAGTVFGVSMEGLAMTYDIRKKYRETESGQISDINFKKYVAKRVSKGGMGIAGGFAGAVIGQTLIPVPVLGGLVGGFIGGMIGSAVGLTEGILIGNVYERFASAVPESNTIEQTDGKPSENDASVDDGNDDIDLSDYEVIDNLVFVYDDDDDDDISGENHESNQIKSNFHKIEDVKSETKHDEHKPIKTTNINPNDYDIYVLEPKIDSLI